MTELLATLLGVSGGFLIVGGMLVTLLFAGWMPYLAWSATRNIRQIRIQLERLNDTLEARRDGGRSGVLGI